MSDDSCLSYEHLDQIEHGMRIQETFLPTQRYIRLLQFVLQFRSLEPKLSRTNDALDGGNAEKLRYHFHINLEVRKLETQHRQLVRTPANKQG